MSANSNLRFDPVSEDRLVRQVIAACAKHGVPYGSPGDLRGFLRALDADKHLAMDFWSMVARMTERGPVADPERLIRVIAEGVTGRSLADLRAMGPAEQIPLKQLASMLAGEDVQPLAPPDRRPVRAAHEIDPAPIPVAPRRPPAIPSAFLLQEEPPAPSPSPAAPPIAPDATRRLTLDPDPPLMTRGAPRNNRSPLQRDDQPHDPNWVIPLEAYADTNKRPGLSGGVLGGFLVIAALIGCGYFVVRNHDRLGSAMRAGATSAVDTWKGTPATPPTPITNSASPINPSPTPAPSPQGTTPAPTAAIGPALTQPAPAATTPPTDAQSAPSDHRSSSEDDARTSDNVLPAAGGSRVVVPEILMNPQLISSHEPEPIYGHAQGRVVMQATVNKHGDVIHTHVVEGDPALRRAAVDAALSRHYRPYLLNGVPVDVATTISIDFPGSR